MIPFTSEPSQLKCLLVNDDPMQLFIMTTVFRCHGYHVTTAQNGFEAFEMIQAIVKQENLSLSNINDRMFCLVLLDLNMPISDGFETCKNITSLYNCKNLFNLKNRNGSEKSMMKEGSIKS